VGAAGGGALCDVAILDRSPYPAVVRASRLEGGSRVTKAEKRLAIAYCRHAVESVAPGYFACFCGCGYRGVCRHCVPQAPLDIPWTLCDEARALVQSGQARCEEGYVHVI
jgi:hypothetical protein